MISKYSLIKFANLIIYASNNFTKKKKKVLKCKNCLTVPSVIKLVNFLRISNEIRREIVYIRGTAKECKY